MNIKIKLEPKRFNDLQKSIRAIRSQVEAAKALRQPEKSLTELLMGKEKSLDELIS